MTVLIIILNMTSGPAHGDVDEFELTTDSRIKTYIYNHNEIYMLELKNGFQSYIEFGKNEAIETVSVGDNYSWKIMPLDQRLFIKPLEKNIRTNMTVVTNKRIYNFDLITLDENKKFNTYVIKFIFPKKLRNNRKIILRDQNMEPLASCD